VLDQHWVTDDGVVERMTCVLELPQTRCICISMVVCPWVGTPCYTGTK